MTNIASTSRSGKPSRQYPQTFVADVFSRVDVAVMMRLDISRTFLNARERAPYILALKDGVLWRNR